jgi:predicted nucleotidyltransferase
MLRESRPPSKLYWLNRDHVAARRVIGLAHLWDTLVDRFRGELEESSVRPSAAWLFGSVARGGAGPGSDIDVLLVPDAAVAGSERPSRPGRPRWIGLTERVRAWSGNAREVLELTAAELRAAADRDDRLVRDLRDHGVALAGTEVHALLRRRVTK